MRPDDCRELADQPSDEAIARHLETCDSCASAARLDRVWEATRRPEPSSADLDALWVRAAVELDRIEAARRSGASDHAKRVIPLRGRRRILAWAALAQAAVILIGFGIVLTRRGGEAVSSPPIAMEVGVDETLVVRISDHGHQVVKLADPSVFPSMADATSHDVFNALESMATP